MKATKFLGFMLVSVLTLLLVGIALAKGSSLVAVRISGWGLDGPVEVSEGEPGFAALSNRAFQGKVPAPEVGAMFYEVGYAVDIGQGVAVNIYHYYPDPMGGAGYMYYADVSRGWSSAEGDWFRLTEKSDRALRDFLVSQGVDWRLVLMMSRAFNAGGLGETVAVR